MSKRKTRGRRPVGGKKKQTASDREILEKILVMWSDAAEGVTPESVGAYLYGITLGTLKAAKLVIRFVSKGTLSFSGDPRVFQSIEEMADELAEEYFDVVAGEVLGDGMFRARIRTERRFLRLVTAPMTWRWSRQTVSMDDAAPIDGDALMASREWSDPLAQSIVELLAKLRAAAAADGQQAVHIQLAELVALSGAAKLLLAIWGNGKEAAALELFADKSSELEYEAMTTARPD